MSLQESIEKLNDIDLSDIDFSDIDFDAVGLWPLPVKILIWVIVLVAVVVGSYKGDLEQLHRNLDASQTKEVSLREEFELKVNEAANLEAYRAQMVEMEESFEALLKQLPQDTEVPGLLDDISEKGLESGLTFNVIDLKPEKSTEFYVELPISISVTGAYHDFGGFVSAIAGLPRIVTLHDFSLSRSGGSGLITMQITAKTYRYKSEGDG
jgi:type IV pilus assembly protein PilO